MQKINIRGEVVTDEIQREVMANQMLCATHELKSAGFEGCYAIVAEFTHGQKILGMLGHYDPSHIFRFEREFPFAVSSLQKQNFTLRKVFVFCKDISNFDEYRDEIIRDGYSRVKKCVSSYDSCFIEYTGETGLVLRYFVQQRFLTFDKTRSLVTGK